MTKSAREALEALCVENGDGVRMFERPTPDRILTALRDHLRTPGTVEVCAFCFEQNVKKRWDKCTRAHCSIRAAKERKE